MNFVSVYLIAITTYMTGSESFQFIDYVSECIVVTVLFK